MRLRIGEWQIDTVTRHCMGPGGTQRLPHKVMRVLEVLAGKPGKVVERELLLKQVWPDTLATDELLSRAVADLRKLFDDSPRQPRYIETLPKLGYRLLADVSVQIVPDHSALLSVPTLKYLAIGAGLGATILFLLMLAFYQLDPQPLSFNSGLVGRGQPGTLTPVSDLRLMCSDWQIESDEFACKLEGNGRWIYLQLQHVPDAGQEESSAGIRAAP